MREQTANGIKGPPGRGSRGAPGGLRLCKVWKFPHQLPSPSRATRKGKGRQNVTQDRPHGDDGVGGANSEYSTARRPSFPWKGRPSSAWKAGTGGIPRTTSRRPARTRGISRTTSRWTGRTRGIPRTTSRRTARALCVSGSPILPGSRRSLRLSTRLGLPALGDRRGTAAGVPCIGLLLH